MKTIQTTVYEFNELSDKAKEVARNWYKEGFENDNSFKDWVYEDATNLAKFMGIDIKKIYFSGFWSQGDGACFEGTFRSKDVQAGKVKEYAPLDETLHLIAKEFERIASVSPNLYFETTQMGRYNHENSVVFDFENINEEGEEMGYSLEVENDCEEVAKRFMKWIYSQFEKAYEHENSNEVIDENIKSNEYTFTAEGKRFGN